MGGGNMLLYTRASYMLHYTPEPGSCYLFPSTADYLSATFSFPLLFSLTNINIEDGKHSWNTALKFRFLSIYDLLK